ncbi:hypothetical protein Skr01_36390 [Sphaerisporangium krabiense]|uniref:Uncharacterized protein n=1 Tax=Sphaerisporangium krabiense TaxID=763782 RepID=A0A7W9DPM3_9ACTN|nr:hypothetical protein [Sphaerisporangium krabiense]MBB5626632.1 hypothetical protein [Sphaerisporangium krabiense]GII63554.1 hypothetical protein Skr01_36390 [Sphaerisporangium krabiense]
MKDEREYLDALTPVNVSTPQTYDWQAQGPVRRAALRDHDGRLLGHVWTDDLAAAGFLDEEAAGADGVRAGALMWAILRDAYAAGTPASALLDPALYAPDYVLAL